MADDRGRDREARRRHRWSTEIREPIKGYFAPFGPLVPHAVLMRIEEPTPDMQPELDQDERELLRLFLRRLVTYYARRRRFAQMGGAASLLRAL
jgi:hypothetical protein